MPCPLKGRHPLQTLTWVSVCSFLPFLRPLVIVLSMHKKCHVVITGTGRAGTTFLVELLTYLGLDTGFTADSVAEKKDQHGRAGLEHDLRRENCPYIVKSPWFCDYGEEILHREDLSIEHLFVPIRDLEAAAKSRRYVSSTGWSRLSLPARMKFFIGKESFKGGLWHVKPGNPGGQEDVLLRQIYKLMLMASGLQVPVTLIRYPRLARDSLYLFEKLKPILQGIEFSSFSDAFHSALRPELIHCFSEDDC